MKIAIHHSSISFSTRWIEYCQGGDGVSIMIREKGIKRKIHGSFIEVYNADNLYHHQDCI